MVPPTAQQHQGHSPVESSDGKSLLGLLTERCIRPEIITAAGQSGEHHSEVEYTTTILVPDSNSMSLKQNAMNLYPSPVSFTDSRIVEDGLSNMECFRGSSVESPESSDNELWMDKQATSRLKRREFLIYELKKLTQIEQQQSSFHLQVQRSQDKFLINGFLEARKSAKFVLPNSNIRSEKKISAQIKPNRSSPKNFNPVLKESLRKKLTASNAVYNNFPQQSIKRTGFDRPPDPERIKGPTKRSTSFTEKSVTNDKVIAAFSENCEYRESDLANGPLTILPFQDVTSPLLGIEKSLLGQFGKEGETIRSHTTDIAAIPLPTQLQVKSHLALEQTATTPITTGISFEDKIHISSTNSGQQNLPSEAHIGQSSEMPQNLDLTFIQEQEAKSAQVTEELEPDPAELNPFQMYTFISRLLIDLANTNPDNHKSFVTEPKLSNPLIIETISRLLDMHSVEDLLESWIEIWDTVVAPRMTGEEVAAIADQTAKFEMEKAYLETPEGVQEYEKKFIETSRREKEMRGEAARKIQIKDLQKMMEKDDRLPICPPPDPRYFGLSRVHSVTNSISQGEDVNNLESPKLAEITKIQQGNRVTAEPNAIDVGIQKVERQFVGANAITQKENHDSGIESVDLKNSSICQNSTLGTSFASYIANAVKYPKIDLEMSQSEGEEIDLKELGLDDLDWTV